jgi:hypothetical protein
VERILASGTIPEFFDNALDLDCATNLLEGLRSIERDGTVFRMSLRDYVQASIFRQPCPMHLRLFEQLQHWDCVTTFNYDEIADYALFASGKLTAQSFEGLEFSSVHFPVETPPTVPFVHFLKVHGSLNWMNHYTSDLPTSVHRRQGLRHCAAGGPEVHYYLGHRTPAPDMGNTQDEFILPFQCKDILYRSVPMFARHMSAFREALQRATDIWIVGKNFDNADRELNGLIRFATFGEQHTLHIIDPKIDSRFHATLFNARLGRMFQTLEEYAAIP